MVDKKRIIKISTPCLVKIREFFRTIIIKATLDEEFGLGELQVAQYHKDPIDYDEIMLIQEEINKLIRSIRSSICRCAACADFKKDHVYNPNEKKWFCEECYDILKKSYTEVDKMPNWFP